MKYLAVLLTLPFTLNAQITRIYTIQGNFISSTFVGDTVNTIGIVTADFQNTGQLGGFFIQDTIGDGDTLTSDGIFVTATTAAFNAAAGQLVQVNGIVTENFSVTGINLLSGTVIASGLTVSPTPLPLPLDTTLDYERYECMLVVFSQRLTVTENFNLGKFGEVTLAANGMQSQPTDTIDPNDDPASGTAISGKSNVAAINSASRLNRNYRITLDDGLSGQYPNPVPFVNPDKTLRRGSTVDNLTGVIHFGGGFGGGYKLEPTTAPSFNYAPRPVMDWPGSGVIRVASFNLGNYFNGDGMGGGFPTTRGADTLPEFIRQREKIFAAIKGMDASIVALTEVENDGEDPYSAIADLTRGLNQSIGTTDTFRFVPHPYPGSDLIKVSMLYRLSKVVPVQQTMSDTSTVHHRTPLAQAFQDLTTSTRFWVIVNHGKSKFCSGATGPDLDQKDGQSCYNQLRKQQSNALILFTNAIEQTFGDTNFIIMGDFNAYGQEDPIDVFAAAGYQAATAGSHSYVFGGLGGALDHALVSSNFYSSVVKGGHWNINSDEPVMLNYNMENNLPTLYSQDAYRSSDHDPAFVDLKIGLPSGVNEQAQQLSVLALPNPADGRIEFRINNSGNGKLRVRVFDVLGRNVFLKNDAISGPVNVRWNDIPAGMLLYEVSVIRNNGIHYLQTGKIISQ